MGDVAVGRQRAAQGRPEVAAAGGADHAEGHVEEHEAYDDDERRRRGGRRRRAADIVEALAGALGRGGGVELSPEERLDRPVGGLPGRAHRRRAGHRDRDLGLVGEGPEEGVALGQRDVAAGGQGVRRRLPDLRGLAAREELGEGADLGLLCAVGGEHHRLDGEHRSHRLTAGGLDLRQLDDPVVDVGLAEIGGEPGAGDRGGGLARAEEVGDQGTVGVVRHGAAIDQGSDEIERADRGLTDEAKAVVGAEHRPAKGAQERGVGVGALGLVGEGEDTVGQPRLERGDPL